MGRTRLGVAIVVFLASGLVACASAPKRQYLVESIRVEGSRQLSAAAIERCMLTVARDKVSITLGAADTDCEAPPFDREPLRAELWSWPWTDWPGLDLGVLEVDRRRIERFYRARGFYDARVVDVRYDPSAAGSPGQRPPPGGCDPKLERCPVRITLVVEEGRPLRVAALRLVGLEALPASLQVALAAAGLPQAGARFDERDYDAGKRALLARLAEEGYAEAAVQGDVQLDHAHGLAHVTYRVQPGPSYRFGRVDVQGQGTLSARAIVAAAGLETGSTYRRSALGDVQQDVYALGAFSAVEVDEQRDPAARLVHLRIRVTPLPRDVFRVGVGVASGTLQRTETGSVRSVPQWDVHLLARYERRHVFGSLGKLRIEESPKLIVQRPFPELALPEPGNVLRVTLTMPGVLEARTELAAEAFWDYGPDPFLGFQRSDTALRLFFKRAFMRRKLAATAGVQHDRFFVAKDTRTTDGSALPDSYVYSFLEEEVRLDLRDDELRPSRGTHFSVLSAQAVRMPLSDWSALRIAPDARVYVPLPFKMVLAARFAVAALFILDARPGLDATSRRLGPASYRLRGGGPQSNRGFIAGGLGAGRSGGLRRWEASTELRVRLGASFSSVLFYDMGDVNAGERMRFGHTNPSAGFGFRYATLVGVARIDLGFRLGRVHDTRESQFLFGAPGVLHATIGEAF